MALCEKHPHWDVHESVILLDGYLGTINSNTPKTRIIKEISENLRDLAYSRGYDIDESFRNENGIAYQLQSMEAAYNEKYVGSIPSTQLFRDTVELYRAQPQKYNFILNESKKMISEGKNKKKSTTNEDDATSPKNKFVLQENVETVLSLIFPNGMRKGSNIARKKFLKSFLELTGSCFPADVDLEKIIAKAGIEYDSKIYVVSDECKNEIKDKVNKAIESGNNIIFYEEFYLYNLDFFTNNNICSSSLLKQILKVILPGMKYRRAAFSVSEHDSIEKDILTRFENNLILTCEEIHKNLHFIPLQQIKVVCSKSDKLIRTTDGTYALTDKICISSDDVDKSKKKIYEDISCYGFSTLNHICIENSQIENPDIPDNALREALFIKSLSTQFQRKRTMISIPGISISAPEVLRSYCSTLDEISISELENYEESIMGTSFHSLNAAYEMMIRVSKDDFVSKDSISFNVEKIDRQIDLYSQGHIIPIKSIKNFISFPEVGEFEWNSYLLDSYCHHVSPKYSSMGGPSKKFATGAIFPSSMNFQKYTNLLAEILIQDRIEISADKINQYLLDNGLVLRKINSDEIISIMQKRVFQEDSIYV